MRCLSMKPGASNRLANITIEYNASTPHAACRKRSERRPSILYRPSGFKPLFYLKLDAPVSSVSASRGSGFLPVAQTDHELGCEMTS
jgi:hypothetical protein